MIGPVRPYRTVFLMRYCLPVPMRNASHDWLVLSLGDVHETPTAFVWVRLRLS